MSEWTADVIARWQKWRNEDHEDMATMSRSDVITLLVEIEELRDRYNFQADANRSLVEATGKAMGLVKLRDKQPSRNPYGEGDPAETDGT